MRDVVIGTLSILVGLGLAGLMGWLLNRLPGERPAPRANAEPEDVIETDQRCG